MDKILVKLFNSDYVDVNLVKLIKDFAGRSSDIDIFIQNIMRQSTGHDKVFGVRFGFKLGKYNVRVISKFVGDRITVTLRSRKFQKILCKMECNRDSLEDFDDWVLKTQSYFEMCENFLYFIIRQYRDGLLKCNACEKYHWCTEINTCRACIQMYNQQACPVCHSHFGKQPHCHSKSRKGGRVQTQ
jgi:hypothetical protein